MLFPNFLHCAREGLIDLERPCTKIVMELCCSSPHAAILCALSPTRDVPFMADESVMAVPDMKLEYNLKHYLAYAKKVQRKTKQLNDLGI